MSRGAIDAIGSALLFGASTPLAKTLLRDIDPWMLAGLLYLGSGAGLLAVRLARRLAGARGDGEARLRGRQWGWLGLAILFGGVAAPGLLMYGLAGSSASGTALLLNLETIFTALLAWLAFGESVDRKIALGLVAIAAGALALTWPGEAPTGSPLAQGAIAAACLAWAIDNNLTRKVALADPVSIAAVKGCVAGAVNVAIALAGGAAFPPPARAAAAALVGIAGYGLSLVLFVRALREVGAARTGAYFSLAPFFGAILAVAFLGEPLGWRLALAAVAMALGVWLHLTERHEHEHPHAEVIHDHLHRHDVHHQHAHETRVVREPHSHVHRHEGLTHHHGHFPDTHHRHPH